MSHQDEPDSLPNAAAIIDRFGGIRPMAAKIGAPVTTVQGWKKRDVIPATRRADILKAAQENDIDIADLLFGAPETAMHPSTGVESAPGIFAKELESEDEPKITVEPLIRPQTKPLPSSFTQPFDTSHEDLMGAIARGHKKAVRTSLWTAAALVTVVAAAGAFLLWPSAQKIEEHGEKIASLEGKIGAINEDVQSVNESAQFLKGMIPEDFQQTMTSLKDQAQTIQKDVEAVAAQAKEVSQAVMASDAGSFSDRLSILEAKLDEMEGGQALKDLAARIRNLEVSIVGQEQLADSMAELTKIVDSLDGQVNELDAKMAEAQKTPGSALGQTLAGVSGSDMRAAALLIAFAQLRESLNRNVPFEDDLALLEKLVGEEDPELRTALDRLAPHAQKGGVLTSEGLSDEFKGLAGDIVVASLKGEDLSVTDKAKIRLTQVLNVKKDGELIGGTPTQKAVAKAQTQLDQGDVQGAIATLQALDGDAKAKAQPFIAQAEATMLADQIQSMLRQMIVANVGTNFNTGAGNAGQAIKDAAQAVKEALPGGAVVKDEESGLVVLPAPKGFKGFSSGTPE